LRAGREDAEIAERLLGEWVHAVLVSDSAALEAIQDWHASEQPGMIALLPIDSGPTSTEGDDPLAGRLVAEGHAAAWVRALLAGSQVLAGGGRVLRRPNGAILLPGAPAPSGPLRRRAELESLTHEVRAAQAALNKAEMELAETVRRLAEVEAALDSASQASDHARDAERVAVATRDDAVRMASSTGRDLGDAETQFTSLKERIERSERRLVEIDIALTEGELARVRIEESLGQARSRLADLEGQQEGARDARVHCQVQEAQVVARLEAAQGYLERALRTGEEAELASAALAEELTRLTDDTTGLAQQQAQWLEARAERRLPCWSSRRPPPTRIKAASEAEQALEEAENELHAMRTRLDDLTEEAHRIDLEMTEATARRRGIVERVEAEWRKPIDTLLAEAPMLDLDIDTWRTKRRESSPAWRPSDRSTRWRSRNMPKKASGSISSLPSGTTSSRRGNRCNRPSGKSTVRRGPCSSRPSPPFEPASSTSSRPCSAGGECDLRLANPDDPLESEIDIHAAPRGKRTQRIHLLSTGERTLVAVSLLFSIYLTKPSPFCLMDEVDAPLDDSNVGPVHETAR
jgi:chromosome segregation protein